ncbi:MAG: hypothetical protein JWM19_882 [Actinomycetia bacterium]|nr:hypothetical protein [Actinomycetes bacterium]
MSEDEEEIVTADGPAPRTWPGHPDVGPAMDDIEVLDRALALMNGPVPQDGMSAAYETARRLLRIMGTQRREDLADILVSLHGLAVDEEGDVSMFAGAGKPRAFGADPAPGPAA